MQWFDLEEVSTGKLHLRLEWLSLLPTAEKLEQVNKQLNLYCYVYFKIKTIFYALCIKLSLR